MDTNPITGLAWALTDFDGMQVGFKCRKSYSFGRVGIAFLDLLLALDLDVQTLPATSITNTTAVLNGVLLNQGSGNCEVWFEYGLTTGYGTATERLS